MKLIGSIILLCIFHFATGQKGLVDEMKITEEKLLASTKQINQFFKRFNGEEDEKGNRYYSSDKNYRAESLRKQYLPRLFDASSNGVDERLARRFVEEVLNKKQPQFLDFHADDWIAEVWTTFTYKGKEISGMLFMRLQQQGEGYAWIIEDVAFDVFKEKLRKDETDNTIFIHPMSHELDFMTLRKALQYGKNATQYTAKNFQPDFLSIFLYEVNQGNMKFETVNSVKFHFFAFEGWYFSLQNINRPGFNTGWLISSLVVLENKDQKRQMKEHIYGKD